MQDNYSITRLTNIDLTDFDPNSFDKLIIHQKFYWLDYHSTLYRTEASVDKTLIRQNFHLTKFRFYKILM